VKEIS